MATKRRMKRLWPNIDGVLADRLNLYFFAAAKNAGENPMFLVEVVRYWTPEWAEKG